MGCQKAAADEQRLTGKLDAAERQGRPGVGGCDEGCWVEGLAVEVIERAPEQGWQAGSHGEEGPSVSRASATDHAAGGTEPRHLVPFTLLADGHTHPGRRCLACAKGSDVQGAGP